MAGEADGLGCANFSDYIHNGKSLGLSVRCFKTPLEWLEADLSRLMRCSSKGSRLCLSFHRTGLPFET
jgi:hypothetical protein